MSDNATILLATAAIAFALSCLTMAGLLASGIAARLAIDLPNQRSLHANPTPRVGGIAVLAGVLAALLLAGGEYAALGIALAGLAVLSFVDDRGGLPIGIRLFSHFVVGAAWLIFGADFPAGWTVVLLAVAIAWSINLYNFMDGADGLAGGMAALGFAFFALAAWLAGDMHIARVGVAAGAAAAGFLLFNFPPARSFLGDVGSVPLGFLAAALGIEGWQRGAWPLWFPLLVFSPFVVDASTTLLRRILGREQFWRAHREHYYQRLVRMGWSHRRLAVTEYALMAGAGVSALLMLDLAAVPQMAGIGAWALIYLGLMSIVDRRWKRVAASESAA
jgi:UDP-N-acetylmuramyl pentapeptide phosphotransferase/UDP-N-acetylglucosamine-1-phosphate transferase